MKIRIATRQSPLALWQANHVKQSILSLDNSIDIELIPIVSRGDKILDVPLAKIGGKGLFVKELETALLKLEADIAVHSMKDVPMLFPEGLQLSAILSREDPRDAFVSNNYHNIQQLPLGASVGTSSLRRSSQMLALRPDLNIKFLRGNLNTRLLKLDQAQYDAIILAAAGLTRLKEQERIKSYFDLNECIPAVGQGAIGIESRIANNPYDIQLTPILNQLNHSKTALEISIERDISKILNGGCQAPIAGFARILDNSIKVLAMVAEIDGSNIIRFATQQDISNGVVDIGKQAASYLLQHGADIILNKLLHIKV